MEFAFRQKRGKITRLLAIHVPAADVQTSATWYSKHFGLTLLQANERTAELAVVAEGAIVYPTLVLTETMSDHRLNYAKNGRRRSIIMMHASNLEGLRDHMLKAGANVTLPHSDREDSGCGRFFEATDPSGNVIQIQANDGEPPAEHTRVEAIFNLEIPVSDVRKSARFYADVLGFHLIREPDDELAIAKTGPYYRTRFGYHDVQEFGFFLFRHEQKVALQFHDTIGNMRECLVLQADDVEALYEQLSHEEGIVLEASRVDGGQRSLQVTDPDGNRIRIVPQMGGQETWKFGEDSTKERVELEAFGSVWPAGLL